MCSTDLFFPFGSWEFGLRGEVLVLVQNKNDQLLTRIRGGIYLKASLTVVELTAKSNLGVYPKIDKSKCWD